MQAASNKPAFKSSASGFQPRYGLASSEQCSMFHAFCSLSIVNPQNQVIVIG